MSNNIIAMLLVLTIVISVIGSYMLLTGVTTTVSQDQMTDASGDVKLFVMNVAEPDKEGATVELNVVK
ncbi:MAG: hypothetical protein PHU12_01155 [Candidatus Aenigmarchaeota archaeon]|nr:hypothetical protein [Candidatus Aenigmarchaeota archaeon]